jgi:hypothetical protein
VTYSFPQSARLSCPIAFQANGDTTLLDSFLGMSIEEIFPTAHVDARTTKFYICELFLVVPFLARHKKSENASAERLFLWERQSWRKNIPRIGMLVGLLLAITWQAASALVGLASLPSTSWCGLCWPPDWSPYWLGAHAHVPGDHSWSLQGRVPNSTASSTLGSLKRFFCHWWSVCSNALACPWWSL